MTFLDALQASGVRYKRSGDPQEVWICCPFCEDRGESADTRFRLGVNVVTSQAHCFNCDWKVRMEALSLILEQLAIQSSSGLEQSVEKAEESVPVRLPEDFQLLYRSDRDPLIQRAQKYMRTRRVSIHQMKEHHVGVCFVGRFAYRIVFPVYSLRRELVGLVGRDFTGRSQAKYLNSVGPKFLYNLVRRPVSSVYVSEGVFKALAIERALRSQYISSLAMLGHSLTDNMFEQLEVARCRRLMLYPDPDRVGIEAVVQVAEQLSNKYHVAVCWPPPRSRKQADELSDPVLQQMLNRLVPYSWHLRMTMLAYIAQV